MTHTVRCLALCLVVGALTGCAVHLRAPEPDLGPRGSPAPPATSTVVTALHLGPESLGALLDAATAEPARYGQSSAMLGGWSLLVERAGAIGVRGRDDQLCFEVPFRGRGTIEVFGRRLDKALEAKLSACARPRLLANARLAFDRAEVALRVGDGRVEMSSRVLADALGKHLRTLVEPRVQQALERVALPVAPLLRRTTRALTTPRALGQGTCLRLRPERLLIGQPQVEDGGLRVVGAAEVRPTIEVPCTVPLADDAANRAADDAVPIVASPDLRPGPTVLLIPVGVDTAALGRSAEQHMRARGAIPVQGGAISVRGARLATARDHLLIRAQIDGQVQGHVLGIVPVRRDVDGEILVWGKPRLGETAVELAAPRVEVRSDDDVTTWVAALERARLQDAAAKAVRVELAPLLQRARKALDELSAGFQVGDTRLPVRVDTRSLDAVAVRADAGNVVVVVRFEGHVVLGDRAVQTLAPAPTAPPRPTR